MIINPYRFAVAGGGIPTPLHFWDLSDLNTGTGDGLDDQGNGTNDMTLASSDATIESAVAPDGGDAVLFASAGSSEYLHTTSNFAWDGDVGALSFSSWIYIDVYNSNNPRFIHWDKVHMGYLFTSSNNLDCGIFDDTVTFHSSTDDSGLNTSTGQWYHVAVTGVKGGTLKTYVDGTEVTAAQTSLSAMTDLDDTTTRPFAIGALASNKGSRNFQHKGNVWSYGVWDVELTASQISELYNSGNGGKYADYTWT
jgi:hypothetical protein